MPSQLLRRLERYLDASVARNINALSAVPRTDTPPVAPPDLLIHAVQPPTNTHRHWADAVFGQPMANIQSVMIHGTSGWPSYGSADNFRQTYDSTNPYKWVIPKPPPTPPPPPHWYSKRGVGPQYFVEPNGTIYPLVGPENLEGDPLFTWHSNEMSKVALGIENADGGDEAAIDTSSALFHRLNTAAAPTATDLTGMQVYALLHPGGQTEDVNLIWFAVLASYVGPGDTVNIATNFSGWRNTLFTERDYRSLALLCRFLAERNDIPRNFPLLPYASSIHDTNNATIFRKLLLADPLSDQIGTLIGLNMTTVRAGGTAFNTAYQPTHNRLWNRFFGIDPSNSNALSSPCFRGFISHLINGHHSCPGPLFDWHRLAREVWDWWWYPFDFDGAATSVPMPVLTTMRPYRQARGNTPLVEYFFDAPGGAIEYENHKAPLSPAGEQFTIPANVPIYAMANGVAVAARLAVSSDPNSQGFLLVRHEIFHTSASTPASRIDYDQAPTYVWSLINFLSAPGFSINQIGGDNPDWLDRFVIRLKETELAVAFHTANPTLAAFSRGWAHQPQDSTRRPTTGALIERDATAYRTVADDLAAGRIALFPLTTDSAATPVTVLLGDCLGTSGTIPPNGTGIQVEIFSNVKLDVPGVASGTVSASDTDWWKKVTATTRHEVAPEADLPANGIVWKYSMTTFLQWINGITWASEWPKYGAVDATNTPVPLPARPNSRIIP